MENQSEEPAEETGISLEEKVSARYERSKCLKELQRELSRLQQLLKILRLAKKKLKKVKTGKK